MALAELTNLSSEGAYLGAPSSPQPSARSSPLGKRAFDALDSDGPIPLEYTSHRPQTLGLSGSSSPVQGRSSSPFQFGAYDAPTSPSFSPLDDKLVGQLEFDDPEEDEAEVGASPVGLLDPRAGDVNPARAQLDAPVPALALPPIDASSPSRSTAAPFKVSLPLDTTLQFGRKAKKPAALATLKGEATLPVLLPKSAKNASRLHCALKIIPAPDADEDEHAVGVEGEGGSRKKKRRVIVRVEVLGQNGMKVDGQLYKAGQVAELSLKLGRELELDFWGWQALVRVGGTKRERGEKKRQKLSHSRAASPTPLVAAPAPAAVEKDVHSSRASTPSAARLPASVPSSVSSGVHSHSHQNTRRARAHTPFGSTRAFTPLLPPGATKWDRQFAKMQQQEDDEAEDFVKPPPTAAASTLARASAASSPAPYATMSSSPAPEPRPVRGGSSALAGAIVEKLSLDLAGLCASAVVFNPRSTVPVEGVIKQMLSEVGGMWDVLPGGKGSGSPEREEDAVEAWWATIEGVLRAELFFGCIENAGLKDAAGNPLQPEFFYVPEKDQVKSRVEALEPFVKRVRASRTAAGGTRYFWRRPVTKKHK